MKTRRLTDVKMTEDCLAHRSLQISSLLFRLQRRGLVIINQLISFVDKEIAEKIKSKRADYVLALKGNQGNFHKDVQDYFADKEFLDGIKMSQNYTSPKERLEGT